MPRCSLIFSFLLLVCSFSISAQTTEELSEKINSQLTKIQSKKINEKVYLHIDRRSYQSGEQLWFKAYIFSNYDHKLSFLSKILTVGLLNEAEESIVETSFAVKGGRASGGINLPDDLTTGNYVLYAYSGWMKKDEESAVFYTQLQVENRNANSLNAVISMDKEQYSPGEPANISIKVSDNDETVIKKQVFNAKVSDLNKTYFQEELKTDKDGGFDLHLTLPDKVESVLRVSVSNETLGVVGQEVIPMTEYEKVDIQFMPEGGHLINGQTNTVAFKAVNFFGDPVDITGRLISDQGDEITQIQSFYGGMGKFQLNPLEDRSYKLVASAPIEVEKDLPPAVTSIGLHLFSAGKDTLEFSVLGDYPTGMSLYLSGVLNNALYTSILLSPEASSIKVPIESYPQGIAQFTLFAEEQPISERLVFVNKHKSLKISSSIEEQEHETKSQMSFQIQVTDENGKPIKGNFSLSVADEYFARIGGEYQASLVSQMLLGSELLGKIPTPNYYFSNVSSYTTTALDLLMLTSGWRRYSWDYIFSDKINEEAVRNQGGQVVATVTDKKGNSVPNVEVQIVNTTNFSAETATTNAQGSFILAPHLVPELENIYFKPPSDDMEVAVAQSSGYLASNLSNVEPWESYYQGSVERSEDIYLGEDYEILDAVVISGSKLSKAPTHVTDRYELTNQMSVKSHYFVETRTTEELFADVPMISSASGQQGGFVDLVKQVTNIYSYNGMTGQLLLRPPQTMLYPERWGSVAVLNGSLMGKDFRVLDHLRSENIEKIEVIKTSAMAIYYGSVAANGAVLVTTKKGQINSVNPMPVQPERVTLKINKEFYIPKYDSNGVLEDKGITEYRKTLHWLPSFNTDDFGKATITYFNDQAPKTATIIIQGTDGLGNLGYYVDQYAITNKEQ